VVFTYPDLLLNAKYRLKNHITLFRKLQAINNTDDSNTTERRIGCRKKRTISGESPSTATPTGMRWMMGFSWTFRNSNSNFGEYLCLGLWTEGLKEQPFTIPGTQEPDEPYFFLAFSIYV
jgi:hypothetical protein